MSERELHGFVIFVLMISRLLSAVLDVSSHKMEFESRVHWHSAPPLLWVLRYTLGAGESVLEVGQAQLKVVADGWPMEVSKVGG
jgi:hypothetical protein